MKVIQTISDLKAELKAQRLANKSVGLVPTMGALHAGHASLVTRSLTENDVTVVSIFVNPTQFNDKNDLAKYPRTLENDCKLLQSVFEIFINKELIAFAPSVEEVYPEPDTRQFSYPPTDEVMEGGFRPGHFNGVCQVVSKLFMMTEPDRAYFGEKDFQQIAVIRRRVEDQKFPLEICPCPIVREEDGLALSSRNERLSASEKETALSISKTLFSSLKWAKEEGATVANVQQRVIDTVNAVEGLEVEYYEIVDQTTLLPTDTFDYAIGCITVYCGPVRLIDNIKY